MRARRLLAAVLLLPLAACSQDPGEGPAGTDLTVVDRSEVHDGGTVRWAVDTLPATLNVFQPAATPDTALLAGALLPQLFRTDGRARAVPDPDYLAAAESTPPGHGPQTVTYRLNPKAVWSDGTPLSVADFASQWKALTSTDPAATTERPEGYAAVESVARGADEREVKVVFKQPYAPWRTLFSPLYPAAATASPAAFGQPLTNAPSAGPFTVRGFDREGGRATVVRNPRWWGDRAKAEAIEFVAVPPERRLEALAKGELDLAPVTETVDHAAPAGATAAAPPDAAALAEAATRALRSAETTPGVHLHRAAAPAVAQLTLNGTRGPLADQTVRRAVAAAVDRTAVAEAALAPLGLPAVPVGHHLLTADQDGYRDNSPAAGREDPAALFDRAGWPLSGNVRRHDGQDLTLTLLLPEGSATARRTAEALTAALARAGVTLRTRTAPADAFLRDHLATGDYDLALFGWPAAPDPAAAAVRYAKSQPGPDGRPLVGRNYARTGTEEIDRLLARATAELDPAARRSLIHEADARIWQLGHSVPLHPRPDLVATRDTLANAGAFGLATPRFQDIGFRED
ncbi:ABC transporter family substrate-binding protein [Kitasatospora sp. NPDC051853]|uniref:ABC transporter family substrate-binding protein n=1 Tax=Kitasatospora sp. NPDC051853 TaxID=3364058 RepID=UPI0037AB7436